mmetsp:Transcript_105993/g.216155  ORF Transcript_105993/g.216155 Transcript_105993/m.216155 type:complete len:373 (+) Transcript_105993:511-1629(+)
MDGDRAGGLTAVGSSSGGSTVSVVAELVGSLGYLRFSQPVLVRSIFARWQPPEGAPLAVVGGRLGLQGVWTTHLDPAKLHGGQGWLNIAGGPLQPVDEVAFLATRGLELGAIEVVAHRGWGEDEERSVLLLEPAAGILGHEQGSEGPKFVLKMERFSAAAAPYVVSLQEAVERNLRLLPAPLPEATGQSPSGHVPGLLTARSPPLEPDEANATWAAAVAENQAMFDHQSLAHLLHGARLPGPEGEALVQVLSAESPALPPDLQRDLPRQRAEIIEALLGWAGSGGGWHRRTPSSLPRTGSEDAFLRYVTAKRWQTKLDLLTAGLLHQNGAQRAERVQQAEQAEQAKQAQRVKPAQRKPRAQRVQPAIPSQGQ